MKNNKLDAVVKEYKRKTCFRIDMLVPTDNNISVWEYHQSSKYRDLTIEIEKNVALKNYNRASNRGRTGHDQKRNR